MASWLSAVQLTFGQDLATRLATPELREGAVESISDSSGRNLSLLLLWGETPPGGVNPIYLNIGLAEAFGKLRAREAIPFLVRNITLDVTGLSDNIWMKADSVIERRLPAVSALIAIGPDASKALIASPLSEMPLDAHIAAVFVISRIADPAARDFLMSAHPSGAAETRYLQEGLRAIAAKSATPAAR